MSKEISVNDVRGYLREAVKECGSIHELSKELRMSPQFIHAVLKGNKKPSEPILNYLNIKRIKKIEYYLEDA